MQLFFYLLADIMSRVTLLYGEQVLLDEYNNHVDEKLKKLPETKQKSASSVTVGFTRGIGQMREDIITHHPFNSHLGLPIGGLFDTKKDFYRLISLLLTDLGLVFGIRSPSPWQVISELRNQGIFSESDSANLKVCLSIANVIRLKTYFANGGQKQLFSPLPQNSDTTEQSTDNPIFHDVDEDTLVHLLSTGYDMCRRCQQFCLKDVQQDEVDASILQNPFSHSEVWLRSSLYFRLEKFSEALKCIESIPKDSPEYAECRCIRGSYHSVMEGWKEAIKCFETALKYFKNPSDRLFCHRQLTEPLYKCLQFKKAKKNLEEAMQLHDEIYGKGSVTKFSIKLTMQRGTLDYALRDLPSAIKTFQRVEQVQKRMMRCSDSIVYELNMGMAMCFSRCRQNGQALDYLERALRLSHKIFGEHSLSSQLVEVYINVADIYGDCGRYHKASLMLKRCSKLTESLYGNTPHPGKIVGISDKWQ